MNRKVITRLLVAATLLAVFAFANHKYKQRNWLNATKAERIDSVASVFNGKTGVLGNKNLSWYDVWRIKNVRVVSPSFATDLHFEEEIKSTSPVTVVRTTSDWLGKKTKFDRTWDAKEVVSVARSIAKSKDDNGAVPSSVVSSPE